MTWRLKKKATRLRKYNFYVMNCMIRNNTQFEKFKRRILCSEKNFLIRRQIDQTEHIRY